MYIMDAARGMPACKERGRMEAVAARSIQNSLCTL